MDFGTIEVPSLSRLLSDYLMTYPLTVFSIVCLAVVLFTRLTSGRTGKSIDGETKIPPAIPYWIPYVGHAAWFIAFTYKFKQVRDTISDGVFGVSLGGYVHKIIVTPSLAKAVFHLQRSAVDNHGIIFYLLENFFGATEDVHKLDESYLFKDVHGVLNMLLKEAYLEKAIHIVNEGLKKGMPHFAPLDLDPAKQTLWSYSGDPRLVSGVSSTIEVTLFPLIRNFTANIASPALMGFSFMKIYPNCITDIWTFDAGLPFFLSKTPSWLPIPTLRKAHAARARLHAALIDFFKALERTVDGKELDPRWGDLSDVSDVILLRCKAWRKGGLTAEQYARNELTLLWAMNVNANNIVFWLLIRICSSPEILKRVREEIAPYVKLKTEESTGTLSCDLNVNGINSCQYLKAAYCESLRMDTGTSTIKTVLSDFTIQESEMDKFEKTAQSYVFKKGEVLHIDHGLHQSNPRYFPEPHVFNPERFLAEEIEDGGKVKMVAHMGSIRPFGGGSALCKGNRFATREIPLFVAGIISTWDLSPVGKEWKLPTQQRASGAFIPASGWRVRLSPRKLQ